MSALSINTWNVAPGSDGSTFGTGLWVFISAVLVAFIAPIVAHESKVSEFRQNWINELRKDIAEYAGLCRNWYRAYQEEPGEERFYTIHKLATDATTVLWRIKMRINPLPNKYEQDDKLFLQSLDALLDPPPPGKTRQQTVDQALGLSRLLLKREWQVTKGITPNWLRSVISSIRFHWRKMTDRPT